MYVRRASHAGSWYSAKEQELGAQLTSWLAEATEARNDAQEALLRARHCQGVVAPHAGHSYSGPTAAWAYKFVDANKVKRVFILGPSHHLYLENCALSGASKYATPLGDLIIDQGVIQELTDGPDGPKLFGKMSQRVDEEEHSIEMHLPYIRHVMKGKDFTIVPIMVGNLSPEMEAHVGTRLAPYLADEGNLFVVSSDFCHWGQRFRYTYYNQEDGLIHKSIENLDKRGMAIIEQQDIGGFTKYLKETKNTICGRHPISVMLNALNVSPSEYTVKFVRYAQSSACKNMADSSVSYASAIILL